jgi:hypothetical protein
LRVVKSQVHGRVSAPETADSQDDAQAESDES